MVRSARSGIRSQRAGSLHVAFGAGEDVHGPIVVSALSALSGGGTLWCYTSFSVSGRVRAAVVLIESGRIAVIERSRAGRLYHVLPGGGVEDGESIEDAAVREAFEELGVHVALLGLVAVVDFSSDGSESRQHYFAARVIGGDFGTGAGAEFAAFDPARGSYRATWMSLEDAEQRRVRPGVLVSALTRRSLASLLGDPLRVIEQS